MGVGFAIASGVLMGGSLIAGSLLGRRKMQSDMKPATLDSFGATQVDEGTTVPFVRGRVRIPGTLLWYGNLETTESTTSAGGKGLGGGKILEGYNYYLDLWQAICQGPGVTLVKAYVNDVEKTLAQLGTYELNDGDDGTYPTEPGAYANPMTGVAHVFLDRYFIGLNQTQVPTIHWVVDVSSSAPLTYANLSNGVNPAALIYDLLIDAEVPAGDIVLSSFQTAANVWYGKGYGLNVAFSEQKETRDYLDHVFTYVDGCLIQDSDDRFVLRAYASGEASTKSIPEHAFLDFDFKRRLYPETFTAFHGKFKDEAQNFSERVARARQGAVRRLLGYDKPTTIDLTAFRDGTTASKRIHEIMEKESYPEGQIECALPSAYSGIDVGAVVDVTHSKYELDAELYRCVEKAPSENDKNEVTFKLVQSVEDAASDDNYAAGAGSQWATPSYAPVVLDDQGVFELPYNTRTGVEPAYLILAARHASETSAVVQTSVTGSDYETKMEITSFSQYGTLSETYAADTYSIDDVVGLLYTPAREDPVFDTIARADLFASLRFAIVDDEIIAFQTVTPEGVASYRLTGCIRGILNTPVQAHASGSPVWLARLAGNVLTGVNAGGFYVKILPAFGTVTVAAALATPVAVAYAAKAATPWAPSRVVVTKVGATNSVVVSPATRLYDGAGARAPGTSTDKEDPDFVGTFEHYTSLSATVVSESVSSFDVSQSGALTLYVRANVSGRTSAWVSVAIGAGDAEYVGPEI